MCNQRFTQARAHLKKWNKTHHNHILTTIKSNKTKDRLLKIQLQLVEIAPLDLPQGMKQQVVETNQRKTLIIQVLVSVQIKLVITTKTYHHRSQEQIQILEIKMLILKTPKARVK